MKTLSGKQKEVFKKALKFSRGLYKNNFNELFGRKHRIEIPINHVNFEQSNNYKIVKHYLEEQGYMITDYIGGYAQKDGDKNTYKIGKLVKDNKYVADKYRDCVYRQNLKLVISRHPYDIACASWNQEWESCLCFEGGYNETRLKNSIISNNLLIAYLVGCNRGNVMGRCFLIPYYDYDGGDVWLHPAKHSYGIFGKENITFLEQWANKNYNEKYVIPKLGASKYRYVFSFPDELVYNNDDRNSIVYYNKKVMENKTIIRTFINKGTLINKYTKIISKCGKIDTSTIIRELKIYIDYHSLYKNVTNEKMFYYYLTGDTTLNIDPKQYMEFVIKNKLKMNPSEEIHNYILSSNSYTKFKNYLTSIDTAIKWDEGKAYLEKCISRGYIPQSGAVCKRLMAKFI